MTLPGLEITRADGNLGLPRGGGEKLLVVGYASGATVGELSTFSQPSNAVDELVSGMGLTALAHILDIAGGTVDFMASAASVAAANSAVSSSAATGPAITVAGTAKNLYDAKVRIRKTGAIGVGRFDYSLDGSETFGAVRTIAATVVLPDSGLTLTFPAVSAATRSGGETGPLVTLTGTPTALTDYDIIIEVTTTGIVGAGVFRWSSDGGATYTSGVTVAATVVLTGTGLTANFPAGTYTDDEIYAWTTGYNLDDVYTFTSTPAQPNVSDLDDARDALLEMSDGRRWKAVLWIARQASASAAGTVAEAVAGYMADLEDQVRDSRALVDCGESSVANVHTTFDAIEDLRLACFYDDDRIQVADPIEGWRKPMIPTVVNAAAMVARFTRGTNIGWVGVGQPPNGGRKPKCSGISFDERTEGEQLHDHKINATTTHVGKGGYYFVNGLLKSPAGSDFRYLHWGLAFDKLTQVVADAMLPYVNSQQPVKLDGSKTITAAAAAKINGVVNAAIRAAVLEPLRDDGGKGFFSGAEFAIDETVDILTPSKLYITYRGVPLANIEGVVLTGGLAVSLAGSSETEEEEAA